MKTRLAVALILATTTFAACSAQVATPIPQGDGNIAGGTPKGGGEPATPAPEAGGGTATPPPASTGDPTEPPDAGSGPTTGPIDSGAPVQDSGSGYFIDTGTGTGTGTGTAPSGPAGSCTNPLCATDGNECGCTATDSEGNTVQLGCQAGGECGCFVNQQLDDNPFDEDGACTDPSSTQQQFLQNCTCN
ncbi:MAG TPA: hypothetical protein VGG39_14350 [Polyangiaceae bacterium]|jgi:hypothetical protein